MRNAMKLLLSAYILYELKCQTYNAEQQNTKDRKKERKEEEGNADDKEKDNGLL